MEIEIFKTEREFYQKFHSGLYKCSMCNKAVTSKIYCRYCGFRADGIFKTMGAGYMYKIEEKGDEVYEIFKPIEL